MDARVALDVTIARVDRTGSGVYISALAQALGAVLGDRLVTVVTHLPSPRNGRRRLRDQGITLARDLWWHQIGVTRAARRHGAALLHLPAGVGPVRSNLPLVVTLHDVMVLRFPRLFRPWFRNYAAVVMPRVARAARAILTGSESSKADVVTHLGIPPERVFVTPYGIDQRLTPVAPGDPRADEVRRRYGLPAEFALAVGALEPRKNLVRVLDALRLVRARPATADVRLVHAGPDGSGAPEVRKRAASLGLEDSVRFVGYVPWDDLRILYGLARLLVFPSLWEGFGLPVVEAMACGCPVVTSRVSSLPEVAGDAALLVEPHSSEEIADALARLWGDQALRGELTRRGLARAAGYRWDIVARQTAHVYDAVLG